MSYMHISGQFWFFLFSIPFCTVLVSSSATKSCSLRVGLRLGPKPIIPLATGTNVESGNMPKYNQSPFLRLICRHWKNTAPVEKTVWIARTIFPPKRAGWSAVDRMELAYKEKQRETNRDGKHCCCWVTWASSWGSSPCGSSTVWATPKQTSPHMKIRYILNQLEFVFVHQHLKEY